MAEKKEFKLEYLLKSSTKILYNRLSSLSGLAEWFADDVNEQNGIYSFEWDGSVEEAKLLGNKPEEYIKFQWLDDEGTDYYFELRIKKDGMTKQTALIITDFAEEDEVDESRNLWDAQVGNLMRILGS